MEEKLNQENLTNETFTERLFTYPHQEYIINVTVWNEFKDPTEVEVLYDCNNVLNAYSMETLQKQARTVDKKYAIVSLLYTKGKNFLGLKEQAKRTGECIVALTAKIKGNRKMVETGLKYKVMKKIGRIFSR